jgi:predicted nucleic acid-binding protein
MGWDVVELTTQIVLEAVRGVRKYGFSYWDAQIWAAARLNQIPIVLTEESPNRALVEGVRFLNPFDPKFDLRDIAN